MLTINIKQAIVRAYKYVEFAAVRTFVWPFRKPVFAAILGGPGAGKGTVAKALPLAHLSTGDVFRREIAQQTRLGRSIAALVTGGKLVPDKLVSKAVERELRLPKYWQGAGLDGIPRTLRQAQLLDKMLGGIPGIYRLVGLAFALGCILFAVVFGQLGALMALGLSALSLALVMFGLSGWGTELKVALLLEVDEDVLIERLSHRRTCKTCGRTYHLLNEPPKDAGKCDLPCGGELYQRPDDVPESISERLVVFGRESKPIFDHYRSCQKLKLVKSDRTKTKQEVLAEVIAAL